MIFSLKLTGRDKMVRVLGGAFVIFACTYWGIASIKELHDRTDDLRAVIVSLNIMKGEIYSHLTPMRDILELLRDKGPERTKKLYSSLTKSMEQLDRRSFSELWAEAVNKSEMRFSREERNTLCQLGSFLGKYDIDEQSRVIEETITTMESYLKDSEEVRRRDSKIYGAFSLTAGIFTVIILI
jgi:stage III sporulation protein AB